MRSSTLHIVWGALLLFFGRNGCKYYSSKKRILDLGDSLLNLFSRPLAKLSKAVKVADTGNQGKAESKALSAVTVTLREDTESFKKTDGVFNKDTFS